MTRSNTNLPPIGKCVVRVFENSYSIALDGKGLRVNIHRYRFLGFFIYLELSRIFSAYHSRRPKGLAKDLSGLLTRYPVWEFLWLFWV